MLYLKPRMMLTRRRDDDSKFPVYTKADFLYGKEDGKDRVFMSEDDYNTLVGLDKK